MVAMALASVAEHAGYRPADPAGWTTADVDALPDDGLRYEIIDGVLIVSPSPTPRHQRVSSRLERLLADACNASFEMLHAPLDWAVADTTVFQPDIMIIRKAPGIDAPVDTPALVVEITSPPPPGSTAH